MNPRLKSGGLLLAASLAIHAADAQSTTVTAASLSRSNAITLHTVAGGPGFGYGAGIEFERILSGKGKSSFAILGSVLRSDDHNGQDVPVNRGPRDFQGLYVAPALRYHPFGARRRTDLSVGVQAATGLLFTKQLPAVASGELGVLSEYTSVFFAPRLELGLNLRCGSRFIIGAFAAGGPIVAGNAGRLADGSLIRNSPFIQAGLRIGAAL